ncbi:MAG TPA: TolC family protein [Mariprofundaceae bacterium]|nr:TolC family protein [Mariprofundaceae bacterium]
MTGRQKMAALTLLGGSIAIFGAAHPASAASSDPQPWTLQRSIERAIAIAPEIQRAKAGIRAGQGDEIRAGEWPNPSVSVRYENNIRRMYRESGYTIDELTYSQPIPLWRIKPQQKVAQEGVLAARANALQTRLDIESHVARLFLSLQVAHDKLNLAEQRQRFTRQLIRSLRKVSGESGIVRYVKPLDRARMQLLAETANQDTAAARNSYHESLDRFRNYLDLPARAPVRLPSIHPAAAPAPLPKLRHQLEGSAVALRRLKHRIKAAEAGVDLQKARRISDPVLTFVHGRNVNIYNSSYSYNGVLLSVTLPLWDQNTGNIEKARANVARNQSRLAIAKRQLVGQLSQNHMRLQHLLNQADRFKKRVLQPAHQFLRDTERHYDVGAATSLALIDAYNTYFNAKNRYLDLLFRSHQSAIGLNRVLGRSLLQQDSGKARL